ncbi:MAG: rhomboid family intramembrane serine protease [Nitrososphaerota archaeon]|nr:rhomboid family intramembrane serine protease [Nitrososphaerota archaeon]MDG6967551.1 rhomboid family intramembrane serine protease [Nitrososphaerota archaeon]MDG7020424.1 rhomboid family intramembrane serine protease [Nitrososphaerota archaeon]
MFPTPMQYGQRYSMLVTYSLIAANVAVYLVLVAGGGPFYTVLAQTGSLFFAGAYWQVFTAMFVHFDIFHIGFNMIALYYFGRLNEISYSRGEYLAIYFGSGLLGNALSLFLLPSFVETGGASGAIFGLIGSYAARNHSAVNIALALVYAGFIFVESSGPGVNIYAHLFGIAGGFLLGLLFTRLRPPE